MDYTLVIIVHGIKENGWKITSVYLRTRYIRSYLRHKFGASIESQAFINICDCTVCYDPSIAHGQH